MRAYPDDDLETSLRNIFDFDIYKLETIERLGGILELHGYVLACRAWSPRLFTFTHSLAVKKLGLDATREAVTNKIHDIRFEPTSSTDLDEPKEGENDADNNPHHGGNKWAGGVSRFLQSSGHIH
jgi:hypothetical protein